MKINKKVIKGKGIKFFVKIDGKEVGRAFLYILNNDLHKKPFGFLEDVYVNESLRGQGIGSQLLDKVINEAKISGCYKIVATSRYSRSKVHKLYERIGFKNQGVEFRIDFS
ncbi:MAG TPA: GNAT family N-acetyltransferase [Candidatus Paceibacterota bacterium]|nr:GNAT family N-acetyltransferase [Candidatus Paceibacterota bacterium]